MGEETLIEKVRRWIGEFGFRLVLWSNRMTAEQYMERVFEEHILWMERK